jgi:hypothetical protein
VDRYGRRILLAVEPGLLQGALAKLLSVRGDDEIVEVGGRTIAGLDDSYDAAIVSDDLPASVRAPVVITLPDTRGSGGMGTVRRGEVVNEVNIREAESVVDLVDEYVPRLNRGITDSPPSGA